MGSAGICPKQRVYWTKQLAQHFIQSRKANQVMCGLDKSKRGGEALYRSVVGGTRKTKGQRASLVAAKPMI